MSSSLHSESCLTLAFLVGGLATACSDTSAPRPHPELRQLLDDSSITLRDSVTLAMEERPGDAERATLITSTPVFSVQVLADSARTDVRISPSGELMAANAAGSGEFDCPQAIPLVEALAIAESEAGGEAIQSVPDDDVECAFEIQVLSGETLTEVKVAPDGEVLEVEPSDEFSGNED